MVPLEILVAMERAWKKEVFSGPRPVFCGSMNTSLGAMAPDLAGASTYGVWEGGRGRGRGKRKRERRKRE